MSKYEQRDNSGVAFDNSADKREGKKDADFRGKAMIEGNHYWVSIWKKESANGSEFLSFSFTPQRIRGDAPTRVAPKPAAEPAPAEDFNDEIPF
jgi:hypothetical protein